MADYPTTAPLTADDRIDIQIAKTAKEKLDRGEALSPRERQAIRNLEEKREETFRWHYYETIPRKHFVELSGNRSLRQLLYTEKHRGIRCAGHVVNLRHFVRDVFDYFSNHSTAQNGLLSELSPVGKIRLRQRGVSEERQKDLLNNRQRRFITEYLVDCNATRAARAVGYSPGMASRQGKRLLKHPVINRVIGRELAKNVEAVGLERQNVLRKLSDNLNRNLWDLGDEDGVLVSSLRDIPPQTHAYIDGFEVKQIINPDTGDVVGQIIKVKLCPNASAQDMAMKFIGAYAPEKHLVGTQKPILDYDELSRPSDLKAIDVVAKRLEEAACPEMAVTE